MGRGRPRKLTHKDQAEEILHGISTSSNGRKTHQATLTEIQLSTPEGMAVVVSDKDKGKQGREEEWPKLTHQQGSGGEVTPEKPWANLFSTNRLAARCMNLNYIALIIVEGEKVVEIMPENVAEDDMKWAPPVVVYVVGVTPSIGAMERFANEEERDKVLCAGPHYLLKRPVIMKPWLPEFNFKEEILTTIPLWIKLPNLPLNCWNFVVGHSCVDKPKVIPAKRGQGLGQRKEWRQTTIGNKNQEKQTEQQSEPIPEVGAQNEKQGSQKERDTYVKLGIEEASIEPEPPNKIC
ncbi:hypothetical protein KY290_027262 [Solanum tuberosum]|uniref:DUF4283 domain-containing protein n=1 Tax=Solanum tuberosum TaxID=4113 RepID=A0ABQ7UHS6_SOLTU|nr:hypothetical protein KY289_029179 [Solanum tuberosum]KAH0748030.1 hypothetical protein KY290_027262 [Solanum tuberosum]